MILIDAYRNLTFFDANFIDIDWNFTLKMYLKTSHSSDLIFENMKASENFFSFEESAVSINLFWKAKLILLILKSLNAYDRNVKLLMSVMLCCKTCFFWQFFNCWDVFNNFSIIFRWRFSVIRRFCRCRLIISIYLILISWLNLSCSCRLIMTFLSSRIVKICSRKSFEFFLNVL